MLAAIIFGVNRLQILIVPLIKCDFGEIIYSQLSWFLFFFEIGIITPNSSLQ